MMLGVAEVELNSHQRIHAPRSRPMSKLRLLAMMMPVRNLMSSMMSFQ